MPTDDSQKQKSKIPRQPGGWEGQVVIADDFDAPLPEDMLESLACPTESGSVIQLPPAIGAFMAELRRLDGVRSAWLIGSRASGQATPDSDWDMLLFATEVVLRKVQSLWPTCPCPGLDLLVVYDGDNFRSPWLGEGRKGPKSGSLTKWEWREADDHLGASYTQAKEVKGTARLSYPLFSKARARLLFSNELDLAT